MKRFRKCVLQILGGLVACYLGIGLILTLGLWFDSGILVPELIFTWPWVVKLFLTVI